MTLTYNVTGSRYIEYIYDAGGSVLRKIAFDSSAGTTTTDYLDGFVYTNGALSYFASPEGRVLYNGTTFTNEYNVTDQQGNVRISFNNTGTGGARKVVQENSYYGFGMILPNSPVTGGSNKNLYNGGSEWQNDFQNQPDFYQTANRNYDASLGRFAATDPMAESSVDMSTYHYAGDNPIMMNDPSGNKAVPPGMENPPYVPLNNYQFIHNGVTNQEQDAFIANEDSWYNDNNYSTWTGSADDGVDYAANQAHWEQYAAEQGITLDFSPKAYTVDVDGYFQMVGDVADVLGEDSNNEDVLMTEDSESAMDVDKYILAKLAAPVGQDNESSVKFYGGDAQGEALFEFLGKNTLVEFTHIEFGCDGNLISTSHDNARDKGSFDETLNIMVGANGQRIREMNHSHPPPEDFNAPSGLLPYDSVTIGAPPGKRGGDMGVFDAVMAYFNVRFPGETPPVFKVYSVQYQNILQFGVNGIIGEAPWW